MPQDSVINALVSWPSAPLTESLVRKSLESLDLSLSISSTIPPERCSPLLQWATYDTLDHELAHLDPVNVLMSSYTIRKALIRKHFFARCLLFYVTKHPESILTKAVPRTWDIDICFADELDEMWKDDLWHLSQELDREDYTQWWILKPGMTDRGIGIRLFNSKHALQKIFEDLECEEDGDDESTTSQLRHFVIQEYLSSPLLLDPTQTTRHLSCDVDHLQGRKFHLRAYCVSSGALTVYLYPRILALFAGVPYSPPDDHSSHIDLTPHLTNSSLNTHQEEAVRILDELIGCSILSHSQNARTIAESHFELTAEDVASIVKQVADILADTFKAALETPVHFQPIPNAFELYGVDFLVIHSSEHAKSTLQHPTFQVKVLEINAEPAIELIGPRLTWILEDLFVAIGKVCVEPFFSNKLPQNMERWPVGGARFGLLKCLDTGSCT